jgi:hypothetical protein
MWEVFDPVNGVPVWTTRWLVMARVVAWVRGLDWAKTGEGWV